MLIPFLVLAALCWCLWLMAAEPKAYKRRYATPKEAEAMGQCAIENAVERFYREDHERTKTNRFFDTVLNTRLWRINGDYRAGIITESEAKDRWKAEREYHQTQLSAIAMYRRLGIGETA